MFTYIPVKQVQLLHMNRIQHILSIFLLSIYLLIVSCAQPLTPTGGPKDEIPPRIIRTKPENKTLNFKETEIVFTFSEYVESQNLSKDIFITPIQDPGPEMHFKGKKLFIKWTQPLKPNTTYILQPGKGIKDVNEKNPLDSIFQFAISTGEYLDSCEISGKLFDPLTGKGVEGVSILLFDSDSISGDSIFKKRPEYAAITGQDGSYTLAYLSRKDYKIYAVREDNVNYEYNSLKEGLGLNEIPWLSFTDSVKFKMNFVLSQPDGIKPKLISKTWISANILELEWNKPIRSVAENKKFEILIQDTLESIHYPVRYFTNDLHKPERIRIFMQDSITQPVSIHLKNVCDTLLNCADTVFRHVPRKSPARYPLRAELKSSPVKSDTLLFLLTEPLGLEYPDTLIQAIDTSGSKINLSYSSEGVFLKVDVKDLASKKIEWKIKIDSATFHAYSGTRADTSYLFKYFPIEKEEYGSISGTIQDSVSIPIQNPLLKIVHKESGMTWYQSGKRFDFPAILAGELIIFMIEDTDENGRWTPGSLLPYRLPERIWPVQGLPKIRAGWDLQDVKTEKLRDLF